MEEISLNFKENAMAKKIEKTKYTYTYEVTKWTTPGILGCNPPVISTYQVSVDAVDSMSASREADTVIRDETGTYGNLNTQKALLSIEEI